jgi:hypothetical protein
MARLLITSRNASVRSGLEGYRSYAHAWRIWIRVHAADVIRSCSDTSRRAPSDRHYRESVTSSPLRVRRRIRSIPAILGATLDTSDIIDINQLMALYGYAADSAKFHAVDSEEQVILASVFTDDAVFDASAVGNGVFQGLAQIRELFARTNHPPSHQMTNVYVYEQDAVTRVKSKWNVTDWPGTTAWLGEYHDVVVPTPEGWRIKERVVIALGGSRGQRDQAA